MRTSPFYVQLKDQIQRLGGMFNAHLHLDRAYTLDDRYLKGIDFSVLENSAISLHEKHSMISELHAGPAYEPLDLSRRVGECLDAMVACGTARADTLVDVTADRVEQSALRTLTDIKRDWAQKIDLRMAAYSPLGFKDAEPLRWEVFQEGARHADFLAALPEADDTDEYPDHIGFSEHCRRFLELAQSTGKMLHVHTDQRNEPTERGTERLVEAVRQYGAPRAPSGEPMVWAVHVISPSTYDEERFSRLVDGLVEQNIGVICCPSAAIGMRQLRTLKGPTYNSIPRVLEFLAAGIHVRLASDNIADICSPSTTADLTDEIFVLSAALRFYNIDILASLAAGTRLSEKQRAHVKEHLSANDREIAKVLRATGQATD